MYFILPLLIFFARVVDVSIGTIRIIFVSKGFKFLSLILGFFEVLIWLVAINQIWSNLSNIWLYIAYAGGFATGNYVGIWLDEKISIGNVMVRIITKKNIKKLIKELKKNGYSLTIIDGESGSEFANVKIIFSVISRKDLKKMFNIIKRTSPQAFYTVEDIRNVRGRGNPVIGQKKGFNKRTK